MVPAEYPPAQRAAREGQTGAASATSAQGLVDADIRALARHRLGEVEALLRSVDPDWAPPPYDPLLVAHAMGIRCKPVDAPWVRDAMILVQDGQPLILYRPGRDEARLRFSLFHEIAHTLFPEYRFNPRFAAARQPRLFEPEGQLERLCDLAASEFMMPMDRFTADLRRCGWGAAAVPALCQRYGAGAEEVSLRMVEADMECCCVGLLEQRASRRGSAAGQVRVVYATPTQQFSRCRLAIPPFLEFQRRSCVLQAARSRKSAAGEEELLLGRGRRQRFRIEALPLASRRHRPGARRVLAFFYPI